MMGIIDKCGVRGDAMLCVVIFTFVLHLFYLFIDIIIYKYIHTIGIQ